MPTRRTRGPVTSPYAFGLVALVLAITAGAALAGSSRSSREPERIFVTAVTGTVSVTMAGSSTPVQLDSTVDLPARIITGDDGMLSLTQAGTNITIAADSDVEIPAEAADGQLIARLVQRRGNVFYDVAHREAGTLRVETPFLVAVIKGTQFNVSVQDGNSTISLFQGRLQIDTPDGSDSVFINAGQIATRNSADNSIGVIGMNDKRVDLPRSGNDDAPRAAFEHAGTPTVGIDSTLGVGANAGRSGREVGEGVGSLGANLDVGSGRPNVSLGVNNGSPSSNGSLGPTVSIESVAAIVVDTSDNRGLHLGTGTGAGNNPGLHLGNGNGNGNGAGGNIPNLGLGNGNGLGLGNGNGNPGNGLGLGNGNGSPDPGLGLGIGNGNAGNDPGLSLGNGNGNAGNDPGLSVTTGNGNAGNNGLHLGTGGSVGDNPGLHLGNGNGNPAPPGKSHGHP
jgi:hypothetical protein